MIKPKMLKHGDTVALVSLSSGIAGEQAFQHKFELGKQRLETDFGLQVVLMPNTLKGIAYLDTFPEARAADLMAAFSDKNIKGIICMIGGNDTIRLLPYIDFTIIHNNPKIFMGYSDTTINHFMMYKAGLVSFYGPSVLAEFAENVAMHEYTKYHIQQTLFHSNDFIQINSSSVWTSEFLEWTNPENNQIARKLVEDRKGYELLQGVGKVKGKLLGGCLDVFPMIIGSEIWLEKDEWKDVLLFLETSEECLHPNIVKYILRGLVAQGIINNINGIIVGKPMNEKFYEAYKTVYKKVIGIEANRPDLPILYNVNFGHNAPMCILPYGIEAEIDCDTKSFSLIESVVIE